VIAPRPYQLEGIQRVRVAFAAAPSVVLVLPTGGGKTIIGSWIIKNALEVGTRSLFVAHRVEIIRQTFCKLVRNGIAIQDVGVIMGSTPADRGGELFPADVSSLDDDDELWSRFGRRRPGAKVQVGSIDTLRVRAKTGDFDLIIIDEAHRALAQSYKTLVAAHPGAFVLGLTATPYRADGEGLEDLFDDLVSIASPAALVADGFLVEPTIWRPKLRADLSGREAPRRRLRDRGARRRHEPRRARRQHRRPLERARLRRPHRRVRVRRRALKVDRAALRRGRRRRRTPRRRDARGRARRDPPSPRQGRDARGVELRRALRGLGPALGQVLHPRAPDQVDRALPPASRPHPAPVEGPARDHPGTTPGASTSTAGPPTIASFRSRATPSCARTPAPRGASARTAGSSSRTRLASATTAAPSSASPRPAVSR
jgi:hypothetical protein